MRETLCRERLADFAPDALQGVIDRFRQASELAGHLPVGFPCQIGVKHSFFEGGEDGTNCVEAVSGVATPDCLLHRVKRVRVCDRVDQTSLRVRV